MEDDRVSLLEQQLQQAKLIAEEADKKYEEVHSSRTSLCRLRRSGVVRRIIHLSKLTYQNSCRNRIIVGTEKFTPNDCRHRFISPKIVVDCN